MKEKILLSLVFLLQVQLSWAQSPGPTYHFHFQNYPQQGANEGTKVEAETAKNLSRDEQKSTLIDFFGFEKKEAFFVSEASSSTRKLSEFKNNGVGVGLAIKLGRVFLSGQFVNHNVKASFASPYDYRVHGYYNYLEKYQGRIPGGKITLAIDVIPITDKLTLILGASGTLLKGDLKNEHFQTEKVDYAHTRFEGMGGVQWKLGHLNASLTYGLGEGRNRFNNPQLTHPPDNSYWGIGTNERRSSGGYKKKERFIQDSLNLGLAYVF